MLGFLAIGVYGLRMDSWTAVLRSRIDAGENV
jgi:hypothetical protein